jgi:tellurite resistance protein TerC
MPLELESIGSPALWAGFLAFVVAMIALDLGVFHRRSHAVGFREAAAWTAVWVALSLAFGAFVWRAHGPERGLEFLTGYLVEWSLSVDNIFIFLAVFSSLAIPPAHQHRVLFWGILTAVALRAGMIFAGTALLARLHWLVYVFGALLVLTGVKLFLRRNTPPAPEGSALVRALQRWLPTTARLDGGRFVTVEGGRRVATPLLVALAVVEATDVVFAVDSIPAVLSITRDPFIVFTSNVLAVMGLRSLFFLVAGLVDRLRYLKVGLAAVLVFVGAKMAAGEVYPITPAASMAVVASLLGASVAASLWRSRTVAARPSAVTTVSPCSSTSASSKPGWPTSERSPSYERPRAPRAGGSSTPLR